jgi:heme a synthase
MSTYQPGLHRYSILLAIATLFLIIAGAAVTSNQAGLSVPDWPLSYGKVMPEMKDGVFFEHGHRLVASAVGFLTIIMAVWMGFSKSPRWMKYLGFGALFMVILQGILGGLTVKYQLPKPVSIGHACLAQIFFSMTVVFTILLSKEWTAGPQIVKDYGWPSMRSFAIAMPVLVLMQLALGAAFRHRAISIVPHISFALIILLAVFTEGISLVTHFKANKSLALIGWAMMGTVFLQIMLGLGAYMTLSTLSSNLKPGAALVITTVAHVTLGAVVLALTSVAGVLVLRNVQRAESEHESPIRQVSAA